MAQMRNWAHEGFAWMGTRYAEDGSGLATDGWQQAPDQRHLYVRNGRVAAGTEIVRRPLTYDMEIKPVLESSLFFSRMGGNGHKIHYHTGLCICRKTILSCKRSPC